MEFEWDEAKRLTNLDKHGIDFLDAKEIWQGDVIEFPSPQAGNDEQRHVALGVHPSDERVLFVVFTWRNGRRRLISARRAKQPERTAYRQTTGRGR